MWVDMGMGGFTVPLSELERLSYSELNIAWNRVKDINEAEKQAYENAKNNT